MYVHENYIKSKVSSPLTLLCTIFFAFGFVTWVNAVLIPFFKTAFELDHFSSYLVTFAFYISYLVFSLPASYLLKKQGFKTGMSIGLWTMACGTLLFLPAAYLRVYPAFLFGLFVIGVGLAIVQTAVNPYITLLGEKEGAARRISLMGICNKTAGIIAPVFLGSFIFMNNDQALLASLPQMEPHAKDAFLTMYLRRVITPYSVVTMVLVMLGLIIKYSSLPEIETKSSDESVSATKKIIRYPHLLLGVAAIFFHVGSQVIAIDTIISYVRSFGLPLEKARFFPSAILFTTICGYLLGIALVPKKFSQLTAFRFCSSLGFVLSCLVLITNVNIRFYNVSMSASVLFIIMLGFANSLIWACIWPLALDRLGTQVKTGSSLLVMGLCGNAIMPLMYGYLADRTSLQNAYIVLLPCYGYLIFYAVWGYKINTWKR